MTSCVCCVLLWSRVRAAYRLCGRCGTNNMPYYVVVCALRIDCAVDVAQITCHMLVLIFALKPLLVPATYRATVGGVAIRFRPNTKSGGPLIVWHRAYSTLLLLPVTIMAEDPEHPLWDTLASAIYTCNR